MSDGFCGCQPNTICTAYIHGFGTEDFDPNNIGPELRLELTDVDLSGDKLAEKGVLLRLIEGDTQIVFPVDKDLIVDIERMLKLASEAK